MTILKKMLVSLLFSVCSLSPISAENIQKTHIYPKALNLQIPAINTKIGQEYVFGRRQGRKYGNNDISKREAVLIDDNFEINRISTEQTEISSASSSSSWPLEDTISASGDYGMQTKEIPDYKSSSLHDIEEASTSNEPQPLITDEMEEQTGEVKTTRTSFISPLMAGLKDICFSTICNKSQIYVSELRLLAPEGDGITITCSIPLYNTTDSNLYWFYHNGSEHILKANTNGNKLLLQLYNQTQTDSGTYKCIFWRSSECCHNTTYITIYSVPSYKYHLMVVGIIAAVCFLACFILSVWHGFKLKKYAEQKLDPKKTDMLL